MTQNGVKAGKNQRYKLIIRRLPPGLTQSELEEQLQPIGSFWAFWFCRADLEHVPWSFARAYIVFSSLDDAQDFRNRFHGYVFVDKNGVESKAVVEMAFHQEIPAAFPDTADQQDKRCNTLDARPDYLEFLARYNEIVPRKVTNFDELIKEVEQKEKLIEEGQVKSTPLTEFLIKQHLEKENKRKARRDRHNQRASEEKEDDKKKRFRKGRDLAEFKDKEKEEKPARKPDDEKTNERKEKQYAERAAARMKKAEDRRERRQQNRLNRERQNPDELPKSESKQPLKLLTKDKSQPITPNVVDAEKTQKPLKSENVKERIPSALVPDPKQVLLEHKAKPTEKGESQRENRDKERKKRPERQIYRPTRARQPKDEPKAAE